MLIHLIDCGAEDPERTPLSDFDKINRELALYSPELATKPQIVAGNKIDLPEAKVRFKKLKAALKRRKIDVLPISAATGKGLGEVLDRVAAILFAPAKPPKNKAKATTRRAEKRG